jgi:hypothetical protein
LVIDTRLLDWKGQAILETPGEELSNLDRGPFQLFEIVKTGAAGEVR